MKKVVLILVVSLISLNIYSQSFDIGAGYSDNGGFSMMFGMKSPDGGLGWYLSARGISFEYYYESGIDYSSIADEVRYQTTIKDTKDVGFTGGLVYTFPNTKFSVGAGLGYGIEQKLETTYITYVFDYSSNEYKTNFAPIQKNVLTAEILIDYRFITHGNLGVGFQTGYNTLHTGFGLIYISILSLYQK